VIRRNLEHKIERALKQFPAVVLLGARQTGKTTLAKMLRPDWRYVDLEKSSDYEFVKRDYDFFFATNPSNIVFDEVQNLPELLSELRGVIDSDRERKGRFILTSSCAPSLLKGVVESLAGRVALIEVGTLKLNEIQGRELIAMSALFFPASMCKTSAASWVCSVSCRAQSSTGPRWEGRSGQAKEP
jgi:predicted AAA+ superfamily ATPase